MIKLIILLVFFILSLLVFFRAPTNLLWYVSILVTEFSWVFIILILLLLFWKTGNTQINLTSSIVGIITIFILLVPYAQAWHISRKIEKDIGAIFRKGKVSSVKAPFSFFHVFTGINAPKLPYQTFNYDSTKGLTLDFYPANAPGIKPCILVVHGGSWAAGDSQQLPELNSELAKEGYHVASINYNLAPQHKYPAPIENVNRAIHYLQQQASQLSIDASKFVLLGRSAGGQVALAAAYTLKLPAIKGVIDFYGPTDMIWGYENPTNPLVLNSRKIMEDYLGGSLKQVPRQYKWSSPTETVSGQAPPTLMIYGENDPLVSPRHGNKLSAKLRLHNIPHYTLYLPWATHAFDYTLNGPGGQLSTWVVKLYLSAIL